MGLRWPAAEPTLPALAKCRHNRSGVYGPSQVRGFDPLAAGNARIEGMYADVHGPTYPYGPLPLRLVQDTRIRVGPAAAGYPFPSPTGIERLMTFAIAGYRR